MTLIQIVFYVFSAVAIGSGLMVVISRNPVHAALFLVLAFVASSGLWLLLQAEFLALILVLVYVGAVMTLFLFVVMMLSTEGVMRRETFVRFLPLSALVVLVVVGIIVMVLGPDHFGLKQVATPLPKGSDYSNTSNLGMVLYTTYAYPFEIAAVLLLTAIISAITLTHRPPVGRKSQNASEQIAVKPNERMRIIKMPPEKKNKPLDAGQNS